MKSMVTKGSAHLKRYKQPQQLALMMFLYDHYLKEAVAKISPKQDPKQEEAPADSFGTILHIPVQRHSTIQQSKDQSFSSERQSRTPES
jgi:hypothetical protein